MQTDPLITWSEPATELIGFVALFLVNGAIAFRYAGVDGGTGPSGPAGHPAATRPQLGSDAAAGRILRSSLVELGAALLVLTVTAVLVSLPSPKG